ncbi:MAG: DNA methyltransferase [Christensenellaceae bacterium]
MSKIEIQKLSQTERKQKIKDFIAFWKDKGYEKGESQTFWLKLLEQVLGVKNSEQIISFERRVMLDHTSFVDGFISETHVLVEQKSIDRNLREKVKQSDGSFLTPFEQAKRYSAELPYSERPRWIITCNFKEFLIYDMEKPHGDPESVLLKNLEKEYYRLQFIVSTDNEEIKKEMEVSFKAGELVGKIYDLLAKKYHNLATDLHEQKSLNMLCVRLVFCLYAEDAGIFERDQFYNYLKSFRAENAREALKSLFKMLDTKYENRDEYESEKLLAFPYVNGGLFSDENVLIPQFDENILNTLILQISRGFDWSDISPTIFGAVFESTLNPDTRRSGGMHYTSIENIHKVIDPLFLDELKEEFEEIKAIKIEKQRNNKLDIFQNKIAGLTFLDPACGSGNFLTETYISLRKLENEIIRLKLGNGQITFLDDTVKVSISQFFGIEINDFAVNVAKTALWISEYKMLKETMAIVKSDINFLPLKAYDNIVEGNALRIDWESVVPKDKLNYIMGNPPFVGARLMNNEQKQDVISVFGRAWKNVGNLDYVACWYKKCVDFMLNTAIRAALVSTNSVSQGESVANLWKPLFGQGVHFDFAHRTFRWDSESNLKAHVHCVIIGFSVARNGRQRIIFDTDRPKMVDNINGYLIDADNVFIENRKKPICNVPKMDFGSMPNDGGFLSNFSKEEKDKIVKQFPQTETMFKRILGATEFINNQERWCLWLKDVSPNKYRHIPIIVNAIEKVKEQREKSDRQSTRDLAETPYLFGEIRQPEQGDYLLVPSTSSEKRKYIPIGFFNHNVISSNANLIIPNATLYHFGVLTSNVHMAWMRVVCGRLKSDYRYSASIVYNNFPWCEPTAEQKAKIEQTAQAILDARAKYSDCSLADLYDEKIKMQVALKTAHQENDKAVMQAYGFWGKLNTESECVAALMKMYQEFVKKENKGE